MPSWGRKKDGDSLNQTGDSPSPYKYGSADDARETDNFLATITGTKAGPKAEREALRDDTVPRYDDEQDEIEVEESRSVRLMRIAVFILSFALFAGGCAGMLLFVLNDHPEKDLFKPLFDMVVGVAAATILFSGVGMLAAHNRKMCFLLLFMVYLIVFVAFCVVLAGMFIMVASGHDKFLQNGWEHSVAAHPNTLCFIERSLQCSGWFHPCPNERPPAPPVTHRPESHMPDTPRPETHRPDTPRPHSARGMGAQSLRMNTNAVHYSANAMDFAKDTPAPFTMPHFTPRPTHHADTPTPEHHDTPAPKTPTPDTPTPHTPTPDTPIPRTPTPDTPTPDTPRPTPQPTEVPPTPEPPTPPPTPRPPRPNCPFCADIYYNQTCKHAIHADFEHRAPILCGSAAGGILLGCLIIIMVWKIRRRKAKARWSLRAGSL